MPQQLLSPYEPTTLTQNISYTLPAVLCSVTATAACETSTNGSTWIPFSNGTETSAAFIRSAGVGTVVTCKPVMSGVGGSSGGGGLTEIPEPLVLSGTATQASLILIHESAASDNRRWKIGCLDPNYLTFDQETDAGAHQSRMFYFTRNGGAQFMATLGVAGILTTPQLSMGERPFAAVVPSGVGDLVNFLDSTVNTIGSTIAGGGSFHVLGRWNGTIWKVIGV